MTQLSLYPTGPLARASDPDTSRGPAGVSELQAEILDLFDRYHQLSDDELCARISWRDRGTVKKRRSELVRAGLLVDTGRRSLTHLNRPCIVWGKP